jgi:hypothetical protein
MARNYQRYTDDHRTTEFLTQAYEGCHVLAEMQRKLSAMLKRHIHISNLGLAYEDERVSNSLPSKRRYIIEKVRGYLQSQRYRNLAEKTAEAVHSSNRRLGAHGHD